MSVDMVHPFDIREMAESARRPVGLPWLILGKGPSSGAYTPSLRTDYNVFALNHAMRHSAALVGHTLDIEVLEQVDEAELAEVEWLCLPWVPHVRQRRPLYRGKSYFGPGNLTLPDYAGRIPLLKRYLDRNRLMAYNFSTAPSNRRRPDLPTVEGRFSFSAAVALRLLAQEGAHEIRTLGVDGGSSYGNRFSDLAEKTKLQTAQTSFDAQFEEMALTLNQFDIRSGPLDAEMPARVFVGCMPEQDLAYRVLEYSIRRHASISVQIERLHDAIVRHGIAVPSPAALQNKGRTPFTFQRFAIPALCGHTGRAIYMDSDMLVLKDLRQLWTFNMAGEQMLSAAQPAGSGRRPQFSVMLIDCDVLHWDAADLVRRLDAGEYSYASLIYEMKSVPRWRPDLPEAWNSLEHHVPSETCLVHFTDMDEQPWLNPFHPLSTLWCGYLLDAVAAGAISRAMIEAEVAAGHVRPSLLEQLVRNERDPRRLPMAVLRRDITEFFPPHRRANRRLSRWKHEAYRTRAFAEHVIGGKVVRPAIHRCRRLASSFLTAITPR